jgi:hypothetical protein
VTTVRVVFALQSIRAARAPDGSEVPDWRLHQRLVVLADTGPAADGSHRAVPLWLRVFGHKELLGRVARLSQPARPAADAEVTSGVLETAVRLLRTAGTEVSAVNIEPTSDDVPELRWDTVTARVELATATGTRPVTVSVEYGLALAGVAGAPVRVADAVMDRLAVSVPGEDILAPFLPLTDNRPPGGAGRARRFEPRNMAFTDGLDYWELTGGLSDDRRPAGPDYSGTAADGSAALTATVPQPVGSGALVQAIYAEDYRGGTVTFRGQLRTADLAGRAGLELTVSGRRSESTATSPPLGHVRSLTAPGSSDWTWHEVTAPVPDEAIAIRFGVSLAGHGRIELRDAELASAPSETGA